MKAGDGYESFLLDRSLAKWTASGARSSSSRPGGYALVMMLKFRRATASDFRAVSDIARSAYGVYVDRLGGIAPPPMLWDYKAIIANAEVWVVKRERELVGFLVLRQESDYLLIENLAVSPAHQHLGIGRHLLAHAESRARAVGFPETKLFTHQSMVENQALYERQGYSEYRRTEQPPHQRVHYRKALL